MIFTEVNRVGSVTDYLHQFKEVLGWGPVCESF